MLTFLRKIRRSLIESSPTIASAKVGGSTRKYILYAVGEIALVVIGILIALQINNWNEEKIKIKNVKIQLSNLVDAIQDDRAIYEQAWEGSLFRYFSTQYLLDMAGENPYDLAADGHAVDTWKGNFIWRDPIPKSYHKEFIQLSFLWIHRIDHKAETPSAIEELKKTDEYSALKNEPLKDAIDKYYAERDFRVGPTAENINRRIIWAFQNTMMDKGLLNSNPFVNGGDPIEILAKDPSLIGRLRGLAQESSWQAASFKILMEKGEELALMIKDEVSKM